MSELIDATVEARLRGYEFAASMCGDRDVLKLTAKEAMQVLFPLVDAWDRAEARASYWQGQHEHAAERVAELEGAVSEPIPAINGLLADREQWRQVAETLTDERTVLTDMVDRLTTENARLVRISHAAGVFAELQVERENADRLAAALRAVRDWLKTAGNFPIVSNDLDAPLAAHDALRGHTPERTSE